MQIIYAGFAGSAIREGDGKLFAIPQFTILSGKILTASRILLRKL